ncbi:hypothetical protein EYF80_021645 [Liparis tanakae]|uniref:Uncharacterized protein n=1 Tax=Liparis tanakae TaxID=230148 RepID=A0A4Z2HTH2_9TELE|nr:hypothetical protein EYF80_021645 [Liparis tanakae]
MMLQERRGRRAADVTQEKDLGIYLEKKKRTLGQSVGQIGQLAAMVTVLQGTDVHAVPPAKLSEPETLLLGASRGSPMNCSVISVNMRAPLESLIFSISLTCRDVGMPAVVVVHAGAGRRIWSSCSETKETSQRDVITDSRISSASFCAVGSTSVWCTVIRYWTNFCSWSRFIWKSVSEMGSRSLTCSGFRTRYSESATTWAQ